MPYVFGGGGDKLTATTATAGDSITAGKSYKIGADGKAYGGSTILNAAASTYPSGLASSLSGTPTDALYFPDARHSVWLPNGNIVALFWDTSYTVTAAYINGSTFTEIAETSIHLQLPDQAASAGLWYLGKYTYNGIVYYLMGYTLHYYRNANATYYHHAGTFRINTSGSSSIEHRRDFTNLAGTNAVVPNGYNTRHSTNAGGTNFLTCRGGYYILHQYKPAAASTEWRVAKAYDTPNSNQGFAGAAYTTQVGSGTSLATGSNFGTYTFKVDDANGKFLVFYNTSGSFDPHVKLLTVDANGAMTLSSDLTETSWANDHTYEYYGAWVQITTTTFAHVYARNSQWMIRTFTYDGNTTITMTGSSGGLTTETNIDHSAGFSLTNDSATAKYVQSGDKLYLWDSDDDTTTWQFDLTNRTIKPTTPSFNGLNGSGSGYHTFNVQANVQPDGSFLVGGFYNGITGGSGNWGRFAARHFDPDFVSTVHSPLIATADASAGATANFMLKPGISSDTVLSTSYYAAKEGMYYPLKTSSALGDGATGGSDQRSATTLDNIRHD